MTAQLRHDRLTGPRAVRRAIRRMYHQYEERGGISPSPGDEAIAAHRVLYGPSDWPRDEADRLLYEAVADRLFELSSDGFEPAACAEVAYDMLTDEGRHCLECGADVLGNDPHAPGCLKAPKA